MNYGEELKRLQKLELSVLEKIIKLCEENDIEYFVIGGTCLGAVRHKGFIPWDDDIDIGMTRENYNKFLKVAKNLEKPLFLQTMETDKKSPFAYAKVRYEGTKFVEYCNRNLKMHQGAYIDVFPMDNIPDNEEEYKKSFIKIQRLLKLYVYKCTPDVSEKPNSAMQMVKAIIRRLIHYVMVFVPKTALASSIEAEMTKYNSIKTKAMSCWYFPKMYCSYGKYETLFPLKECEFENLTVKCPNDTDTYLKDHYGDYMKLPPEKDRVGHRPYVFDIENI